MLQRLIGLRFGVVDDRVGTDVAAFRPEGIEAPADTVFDRGSVDAALAVGVWAPASSAIWPGASSSIPPRPRHPEAGERRRMTTIDR